MNNFKIKAILFASILLLYLNCTIRYYDTNRLINDYTTEGFLDRDHYQVIINGTPDKGAKGLVAERESAYENAKSKMENKVLDSLINYNLNYHINKLKIKDINDIENLQDIKKDLASKLRKFFKFGYIAFEYYNENNSSVIVYRIFSEDLIEKIESIKPDIKLKSAAAITACTRRAFVIRFLKGFPIEIL